MPVGVSNTIQAEPPWVFVVIFIGFFLMIFLPIMNAIGPVSFVIVPFVLIGLKKAAKRNRDQSDTQWYGADITERQP